MAERTIIWMVATTSSTCGGGERVGFQNAVMAPDQRFHAAVSYSLMSPPRTGRRRIGLSTGSGTGDVGRGGRSRSARCGRRAL